MEPHLASLLTGALIDLDPGDEPFLPADGEQPGGAPLEAARPLAAQPGSIRAAREFTRATLSGWEMRQLADDAVLVVSELVTNALQHGGPGPLIWLRLLAQRPYLMCMVTDAGHEVPLRRQASPAESTGRGLQVIESCASRWGWHLLDDGGKVVWALLPRR
jgi:anti-sigma regulatory factor (Ser/Thr protein kinase)